MEHFSTARLTARDWTMADDQSAFAIYGREEVTRWLGAPPAAPAASLAEMRQRLARIIERNASDPGFGLWPIELRDSGLVVGAVLLVPLAGAAGADRQDFEIGWHLNPDNWGRGYATEAGRGAIDLSFGERGLSEVLAVVYPANAASLAVCRRLGMIHRGQTSRYYGVTLELFSVSAEPGRPGTG